MRSHFHEVSSVGQPLEKEGVFMVAVSWGGG